MIVSKSQSQATLPEERSRRLTSVRLAIACFIIHYLGWQASNMFWGHLSQMLLYRASEATTFVNTCRLPITNRGKPASDHFRLADHNFRKQRVACLPIHRSNHDWAASQLYLFEVAAQEKESSNQVCENAKDGCSDRRVPPRS